MRLNFLAVQLFIIYCPIIIFFVCRYFSPVQLSGFSWREKLFSASLILFRSLNESIKKIFHKRNLIRFQLKGWNKQGRIVMRCRKIIFFRELRNLITSRGAGLQNCLTFCIRIIPQKLLVFSPCNEVLQSWRTL